MVLAMRTVEIPMQGPKTEQTKEGEREKGLGKSTNTEDSNTKHQGFLVLSPYIVSENPYSTP